LEIHQPVTAPPHIVLRNDIQGGYGETVFRERINFLSHLKGKHDSFHDGIPNREDDILPMALHLQNEKPGKSAPQKPETVPDGIGYRSAKNTHRIYRNR
jgi:hypothetical protein